MYLLLVSYQLSDMNSKLILNVCLLCLVTFVLSDKGYHVKLELTHHFPIVEIQAGKIKIRLAVDTGALTTWVINNKCPNSIRDKFDEKATVDIKSVPRYHESLLNLLKF